MLQVDSARNGVRKFGRGNMSANKEQELRGERSVSGGASDAQDSAADFLRPIVTQTRDTAVLDALAGMIEKAGLRIGDRIPSETVIAQRLRVGRSTIREALKGWETLGIIRRRKGAGTYLAAEMSAHTFHAPFTLRLEGVALLRTIQVRRVLEVAVVREAALNATDEQRRLIKEQYQVLSETLETGGQWRLADAAFHIAIYDASGNPIFGQMIRQLEAAFHRIYIVPFGKEDIGMSSFEIHGDLCDAVVEGDPDRAEQVIVAILDLVEADIKRAIK
jgi:GntR family transcriptional regulator, transcriptional repressor for pyruvate dehydrogenase complex